MMFKNHSRAGLLALVFVCCSASCWACRSFTTRPTPRKRRPASERQNLPRRPATPRCRSTVRPNSGDTAWMMTSVALVLMMTIPGLGLFYGGMVRRKNVGDTVMTSFAITCLDQHSLAGLHV